MEVSQRRVLQKHLEPARPLRRCVCIDSAQQQERNADLCTQAPLEANVGVEQLHKIVHHDKLKQGRIPVRYTRDFLIGLASCPEAMTKPEFLPDHPIVLPKARDPGLLRLHEMRWNGKHEEE
ncbi:uncharacterized protein C8orf88 homolog isoform X2 [Thalassophryne amazonica]|nr:uncharacterized protein C8orf88 homolog isoform X2 [Thalassophryne amazonica]XP_034030832.1 uncharacterized protein C8orf88 homolog isoform X2 [Thalassophryne amazonica]